MSHRHQIDICGAFSKDLEMPLYLLIYIYILHCMLERNLVVSARDRLVMHRFNKTFAGKRYS